MSLSPIDPKELSRWHVEVTQKIKELPLVKAAASFDKGKFKAVYDPPEAYITFIDQDGNTRRINFCGMDGDNKLKYGFNTPGVRGSGDLFPNTSIAPYVVIDRIKNMQNPDIAEVIQEVLSYNLETIATNAFSKKADHYQSLIGRTTHADYYLNLLTNSTGDEECDRELLCFIPPKFFEEHFKPEGALEALCPAMGEPEVRNISFRRKLVSQITTASELNKLWQRDVHLLTAQQVSLLVEPKLLAFVPASLAHAVQPNVSHHLSGSYWNKLTTREQIENVVRNCPPNSPHLNFLLSNPPSFQLIEDIDLLASLCNSSKKFYGKLSDKQLELIGKATTNSILIKKVHEIVTNWPEDLIGRLPVEACELLPEHKLLKLSKDQLQKITSVTLMKQYLFIIGGGQTHYPKIADLPTSWYPHFPSQLAVPEAIKYCDKNHLDKLPDCFMPQIPDADVCRLGRSKIPHLKGIQLKFITYKQLGYIDLKQFKFLSPKQKLVYTVATIASGLFSLIGSALIFPALFSDKVRNWSLAPAKRLWKATKYLIKN